jgi:hypothetical protein
MQLNSIPPCTRRVIFEISKSKYHTKPKNEEELYTLFVELGKTFEVAALSPQSLYQIYLTGLQTNKTTKSFKKKKRKHKK